jgi:hypothetical protein
MGIDLDSGSQQRRRILMARWRKNESLSRVLAREGRGIAKGVAKELLSIATFGALQTTEARSQNAEVNPREDIAGQAGRLAPVFR